MSRAGLNVCVGTLPRWYLVTRRMSSSLFPENIGPQMTSIQPSSALRCMASERSTGMRPLIHESYLDLRDLGDLDEPDGVVHCLQVRDLANLLSRH